MSPQGVWKNSWKMPWDVGYRSVYQEYRKNAYDQRKNSLKDPARLEGTFSLGTPSLVSVEGAQSCFSFRRDHLVLEKKKE